MASSRVAGRAQLGLSLLRFQPSNTFKISQLARLRRPATAVRARQGLLAEVVGDLQPKATVGKLVKRFGEGARASRSLEVQSKNTVLFARKLTEVSAEKSRLVVKCLFSKPTHTFTTPLYQTPSRDDSCVATTDDIDEQGAKVHDTVKTRHASLLCAEERERDETLLRH